MLLQCLNHCRVDFTVDCSELFDLVIKCSLSTSATSLIFITLTLGVRCCLVPHIGGVTELPYLDNPLSVTTLF